MRFLLVAVSVALASSCAARHDVFVAWTIDGFPATAACGQLADPTVRFQVSSRDVAGGVATEETSTTGCIEESAAVQAGNFADIVIEILDGELVYGASRAISVNPGAGGHYAGHDAEEAITADVELQRGRLKATLRVVGESCGDAGAGDFAVTVRRKSSPLGTEIVAEETVSCPGGDADAVLEVAPVEIGSIYDVIATTTIGGEEFATNDAGGGEGVLIETGLTDLTVDLDVVGRPGE